MKNKFINSITELKSNFWLINILQMFERISYAALVLQMAVYIAQKDLVGGLQWSHTTKGTIFFFWAIVQNLTPVFLGGLADKFGRKKIILISAIFVNLGYFLLGTQREFTAFLIGTILLGFGLGLYKPAIQGWIAKSIENANSSLAWGINVMLINFAVFFSPSIASFLQEISWTALFWGCGAIFSINLIALLFIKDKYQNSKPENSSIFIKELFIKLLEKKLIFIVFIMSGFTMIYMQFYETLPNFIMDWIDTSTIVTALNLPKFMTFSSNNQILLDFKYIYALNSAIIVLFVVILSYYMSKINPIRGLIIGLLIASFGLFFSGVSNNGFILIFGVIFYTFGELITNPRFNEYMSKLGGEYHKSMYLGFMNISFAIGLAGGSLLGGCLYHNYGEKSGFAIKYLNEVLNVNEKISHSNAMEILMQKTGFNFQQATELLWNYYNPFMFWFFFLAIGLLSSILLYLYNKKYNIDNN